jgi:3-hydroxybutyryl-CoA dehydratase
MTPNQTRPEDHSFEELQEGTVASRTYHLSRELYRGYLDLFGDRNPLHVDPAYARQQGFRDVVMHGGILHGCLSHFVGMCFPGRRSVLVSVDLAYLQPCYADDVIDLKAVISHRQESLRVVELGLTFHNSAAQLVARGHATVKIAAEG